MIKDDANAMARERGLRSRTSCPHLGGMHRNCSAPPSSMKTATLPSLRVGPELREAAESVLKQGETLSGFIETSVRETIERRRVRAEFIARGLAAREEIAKTGVFFAAQEVHAELSAKLAKARARLRSRVPKRARGA